MPLTCTTGGQRSYVFTPGAGDRYYLAVPHNDEREGGYGFDSTGQRLRVDGDRGLVTILE